MSFEGLTGLDLDIIGADQLHLLLAFGCHDDWILLI
jgi:hypothetical protein